MKLNTLFRSAPVPLVYFILLIPIPLYFLLGIINKLGPDPLRFLEHKYGELGLIFLLITLSISPLLRYGKINLMKFRRCIGLVAFYYIVSHVCVYFFLDIGLSLVHLRLCVSILAYVSANFTSSWAILGSILLHLGYILGNLCSILIHLGPILGHLGFILAPSWLHLLPSWLRLGPSWLHLGLPWGTILEAFWLLVPVLGAPRAKNGRILGGLLSASFLKRFSVLFWVDVGPQKR